MRSSGYVTWHAHVTWRTVTMTIPWCDSCHVWCEALQCLSRYGEQYKPPPPTTQNAKITFCPRIPLVRESNLNMITGGHWTAIPAPHLISIFMVMEVACDVRSNRAIHNYLKFIISNSYESIVVCNDGAILYVAWIWWIWYYRIILESEIIKFESPPRLEFLCVPCDYAYYVILIMST